jgi:hypothetical protein
MSREMIEAPDGDSHVHIRTPYQLDYDFKQLKFSFFSIHIIKFTAN